MPTERHLEIARRLSQLIPDAPKPTPKVRASWRGVRVGDQLAETLPIHLPLDATRQVLEVTSCDTEGLWVRVISPHKSSLSSRLANPVLWRKLKKKERL